MLLSNHHDLPKNEIDVESLVFVERYVTNLLKLDLLTYFGNNPEARKNAQEIAKRVGRSYKAVRSELGDLTLLELLQKSKGEEQPTYQLTNNAVLRPKVIRFAKDNIKINTI